MDASCSPRQIQFLPRRWQSIPSTTGRPETTMSPSGSWRRRSPMPSPLTPSPRTGFPPMKVRVASCVGSASLMAVTWRNSRPMCPFRTSLTARHSMAPLLRACSALIRRPPGLDYALETREGLSGTWARSLLNCTGSWITPLTAASIPFPSLPQTFRIFADDNSLHIESVSEQRQLRSQIKWFCVQLHRNRLSGGYLH